ncbi:MAG TPA: hypothetical protein VM867_11145 [Xanthobacteraceae bacterium]|nr:hypothetical protein [Xanthobacteraceae bacterium]
MNDSRKGSVVDRFVRTGERIARSDFVLVQRRKPGQRRARALLQFIAAAGLVLSLAVAVAVVTIEFARAQSAPSVSIPVVWR